MIQVQFRPILIWPGKRTPNREQSRFKASYPDTLGLLETELEKLHAKQIIIQAGFQLNEIRADGWPKSSARPKDPGVILNFQSKNGPLSFPCDTFPAWEDNLRAIAKSLEALRMVDRYGVTRGNEQYKGFAQLSEAPVEMTLDDAAAFVAHHSGNHPNNILTWPHGYRESYKLAARKLHPDAGGSHDLFVKLGQAQTVLNKHHGL